MITVLHECPDALRASPLTTMTQVQVRSVAFPRSVPVDRKRRPPASQTVVMCRAISTPCGCCVASLVASLLLARCASTLQESELRWCAGGRK
jgi:hypothetical protein